MMQKKSSLTLFLALISLDVEILTSLQLDIDAVKCTMWQSITKAEEV